MQEIPQSKVKQYRYKAIKFLKRIGVNIVSHKIDLKVSQTKWVMERSSHRRRFKRNAYHVLCKHTSNEGAHTPKILFEKGKPSK